MSQPTAGTGVVLGTERGPGEAGTTQESTAIGENFTLLTYVFNSLFIRFQRFGVMNRYSIHLDKDTVGDIGHVFERNANIEQTLNCIISYYPMCNTPVVRASS